MKHSDYVEILKGAGKEALKKAIVGALVKNAPFLATGPWNYVLVKTAIWLAEKIIQEGEMAIFFQYIDFRTDAQAKDFEEAMINNHKAQHSGTDDEKKIAEKVLVDALNRLVSLKR